MLYLICMGLFFELTTVLKSSLDLGNSSRYTSHGLDYIFLALNLN